MTNETITPTPWYVDMGSYGDVWIVGNKENWVPRICHIPDYSKANDDHIVKCVNMHDELVDLLVRISRSKESCFLQPEITFDMIKTLKKAGAL